MSLIDMTPERSSDPQSDLRRTARTWVLRLASDDLDATDLAELKAWRATPECNAAFEAERRLYRSLQPLEAAFASGIVLEPAATVSGKRRKARALVLAAGGLLTVAAMGVIWDPLLRLRADNITARGQIARVELPDGSIAMLDSDSAIGLDFDGKRRRVHLLKGAAWFQVVHDRTHPFIVDANSASALAVGTAFEVRKDGNGGATLMVTEGRVRFSSDARSGSIDVTAGGAASTGAGLAAPQRRALAVDDELAWRSGRLIFENRSLAEVAAALDRYRSGRILVLGDAAERRVSGVLEVGAIDKGLDGLAAAQGLKVTRVTPWLVILR